jgi:KNTase C-terminal domain
LHSAGVHSCHLLGASSGGVTGRCVGSRLVALFRIAKLGAAWSPRFVTPDIADTSASHSYAVGDMDERSKTLRGKPAVFAELNRLVFDHAEDQFRDVIRNIIVAELFEGLGKVRNAKSNSNYAVLPRVAMRIATMAELLIGLAHKHIYTASGLATVESMALSPRPAGHDELCTMVMRGELDHPNRTSQVIENYWKGVVEWAADSNIDLARACRWPI